MERSNTARPRMSSLSLFKASSCPLDKPHVQIYCGGVLLCLHLQSSDQLSHINGWKGQRDLAIKPQMTNISSCRSASLSMLAELCFLRLDKGESRYPNEGFLWPGNVAETKHTTWGLLFSGPSLFAERLSCDIVSAFYFSVLSQVGRCSVPPCHSLSSSTPAFFSSARTLVSLPVWISTRFSLNQWLQQSDALVPVYLLPAESNFSTLFPPVVLFSFVTHSCFR